MEEKRFKAGFVGIVGPTNAGKSTLLNALVGEKVSIVSFRSQTTYHAIRGVVNTPHSQVIFVDMPGFQRHRERMAKLLNAVADRNAKDCDCAIWVFDVSGANVLKQVENLAKKIEELHPLPKRICVLNQIDKIAKPKLLPLLEELHRKNLFAEIIPISAKTGDGVSKLLPLLEKNLPDGVPLFPTDKVTDRPANFLISEFIREKIYRFTGQEIPYSVWVEMEQGEEGGTVPIYRAVVHVDSQSRKGILIGKGGQKLKEIGTEARKEIERFTGHKICLKLFIDVQSEWKNNADRVHRYLELA